MERKKSSECWMCASLSEDQQHLVYYQTERSLAKLNPDQSFNGYSFVVLKWHETELYNLSDDDRRGFLEDMSRVSRALAKAFKPDKMNYELLGNGMPHLHWHLIPRYKSDPFWGRPIWTSGSKRRRRLTREGYEEMGRLVKESLQVESRHESDP